MAPRSWVLHTEGWYHSPFKAANFCNIWSVSGVFMISNMSSTGKAKKKKKSLIHSGKISYLSNIWLQVQKYREISVEIGKGKTINRWKCQRKKSKKVSLHMGNSISFYTRCNMRFHTMIIDTQYIMKPYIKPIEPRSITWKCLIFIYLKWYILKAGISHLWLAIFRLLSICRNALYKWRARWNL